MGKEGAEASKLTAWEVQINQLDKTLKGSVHTRLELYRVVHTVKGGNLSTGKPTLAVGIKRRVLVRISRAHPESS